MVSRVIWEAREIRQGPDGGWEFGQVKGHIYRGAGRLFDVYPVVSGAEWSMPVAGSAPDPETSD